MKPNGGFTLVEMMISVAIMAILLGLAAPGFQSFIQNAKIRTTADNIQAGLHLARSEAIRRNARVSFWLVNNTSASCARSASGTSWVVSFSDPAGACNTASSDTVAPRLIQSRLGTDDSTGVSVSAASGGATSSAASCITFNGFGGVEPACTGGGTRIGIINVTPANGASTARRLDVRITSGGAVRMCNPDSSRPSDLSYCGS